MLLQLPGSSLVKPDRMGMAGSLEARPSFLDYRMMEFAFCMPGHLKLRDRVTKYLFKKAVASLIGERLAIRKRQMFAVPAGAGLETNCGSIAGIIAVPSPISEKNRYFRGMSSLWLKTTSRVRRITHVRFALMALEHWQNAFREHIC